MVFLVQHTQNKDNTAMHLKMDELLRAVHDARDSLIDLEHAPDDEIARVNDEFHKEP